MFFDKIKQWEHKQLKREALTRAGAERLDSLATKIAEKHYDPAQNEIELSEQDEDELLERLRSLKGWKENRAVSELERQISSAKLDLNAANRAVQTCEDEVARIEGQLEIAEENAGKIESARNEIYRHLTNGGNLLPVENIRCKDK